MVEILQEICFVVHWQDILINNERFMMIFSEFHEPS